MSTGKENFTLEKEENGNERIPIQTVRGINFAHKSPGGETNILYNGLVLPGEFAASGFTNPSASFLMELGLSKYKGNLEVTSSLTTLQKSDYQVTSTGIFFKSYISTLNEIFEVSLHGVISGGQYVSDVRSYKFPGEILDGFDEFNIGIEVDIFDFNFLVFRNGQQVFQSDNNDSSGATGNFYIVDLDGDGRGSTLKFFDPAVGDEAMMVASNGGVVDSPTISTFQEIDFLGGQLDAIIPTVAVLAGVPESNFRGAPARPNVLAFAARVSKIEANFNALLDKLDADTGVNSTDYKTTLGL